MLTPIGVFMAIPNAYACVEFHLVEMVWGKTGFSEIQDFYFDNEYGIFSQLED